MTHAALKPSTIEIEEELCYRERAEQMIKEAAEAVQHGLAETKMFLENTAEGFANHPLVPSRFTAYHEQALRNTRFARAVVVARAKRATCGVFDRKRPPLPKELQKQLRNGEVPRQIGDYSLTRGQRIQLKQNKLRAAKAKERKLAEA